MQQFILFFAENNTFFNKKAIIFAANIYKYVNKYKRKWKTI